MLRLNTATSFRKEMSGRASRAANQQRAVAEQARGSNDATKHRQHHQHHQHHHDFTIYNATQNLRNFATRERIAMASRENSHEPPGTPAPVETGIATLAQLRYVRHRAQSYERRTDALRAESV